MRKLVLFLVVVSLFLVQCGSFHPMAQTAGPQGPAGPVGPVGPAGPQGATGPQGSIGLTGATGATGAVGAQGPIGPAGPQGLAGQGFNFRGAYAPGNSYNAYDLTTESGSTYVALQANQNVDPATDVANAGGHWAVEALAGAQGQTGPQGPIGLTGVGLPGPIGPPGPQGAQGIQGVTGPTGPQGPPALLTPPVFLTGNPAFVASSFYTPVAVNGLNAVTVGPSGIVQVIAKAIFTTQPAATSDGVCYVNSSLNGVIPANDTTAAVVYVPLPLVPPPGVTPVASGEVTNSYVGLPPGSRMTVDLLIRSGNIGGPFTCQTASETLTFLTY